MLLRIAPVTVICSTHRRDARTPRFQVRQVPLIAVPARGSAPIGRVSNRASTSSSNTGSHALVARVGRHIRATANCAHRHRFYARCSNSWNALAARLHDPAFGVREVALPLTVRLPIRPLVRAGLPSDSASGPAAGASSAARCAASKRAFAARIAARRSSRRRNSAGNSSSRTSGPQPHVLGHVGRGRRTQQRVDLARQTPFPPPASGRSSSPCACSRARTFVASPTASQTGQSQFPSQTVQPANSRLKSAKCRRPKLADRRCCAKLPAANTRNATSLPASSRSPATKTPPSHTHRAAASPSSEGRTARCATVPLVRRVERRQVQTVEADR